ncbi:MAG TPA: SEC-C metal-binding domain-containing protein, partial [Vicinamibacterales bacterium]|nr:SEC-C metal-binding domain-containing protein [Vicinamibacterales bacterium]
ELAEDVLDAVIDTYVDKELDPEEWDLDALKREASRTFAIDPARLDFAGQSRDEMRDQIWEQARTSYTDKEKLVGPEVLGRVERDIMLQIVDTQWKDHLYSLDHLKEGIGLRGYGQRDPLVEYKKESFAMFQAMKDRVDGEIVNWMWRLQPVLTQEGAPPPAPVRRPRTPLTLSGGSETPSPFGAPRPQPQAAGRGGQNQPPRVGGDDVIKTVRRDVPKVGRNDPCPCGSGKKYKKCHGAQVTA